MFNIGAGEMVLILVAALLILGPQRLPELARAIGKFMREFRRQTDEVRNVVEREFYTMDEEFQRPLPRTPAPPSIASHVPPESAPQALPPPPQHVPLPDLGNTHLASPQVGHALLGAPELEPAPLNPEPPPASPAQGASDSEGPQRLAPLPGTVARNAPKQS